MLFLLRINKSLKFSWNIRKTNGIVNRNDTFCLSKHAIMPRWGAEPWKFAVGPFNRVSIQEKVRREEKG